MITALMNHAARIAMARYHAELSELDAHALHQALSEAVMESIAPTWTQCERKVSTQRHAAYLSAEYLTGRLIQNNLLNAGILADVREALAARGVDANRLEEIEDAALGNGGLGRLAACYLDSAATHDIPLRGYGLRYRYGLFRQSLTADGEQTEAPDDWMRYGDPWSIRREDRAVTVALHGMSVRAVPYDMPVIGYGGHTILTLRLWQCEAPEGFDFHAFHDMRYARASRAAVAVEDITKVLYPNDWGRPGQRLRLRQEYVLAAASIADLLREYRERYGADNSHLADMVAIQLNDTHPVLAIPEWIRCLMAEGFTFDEAFSLATPVFSYTNHTVMPEALECWDERLIRSVVPALVPILRAIDRKCAQETGWHIIVDGRVHMADLAVYASHATNGVAKIHSDLIQRKLFAKASTRFPDRFLNVTNGITQRRWLMLCNPELCQLIERRIGGGFVTQLDELEKLAPMIDADMKRDFLAVKQRKKAQLSEAMARTLHVTPPPTDWIFDVQIKRLHEYKRQLMNAFSLYDFYREIQSGALADFPPTVFLFGAKAAAGYSRAKAIIRYINQVAARIAEDPVVSQRMRVYFVPNYSCSWAEKLIPAADFSEQISPAGTEASGTSNMKFMLNGAITIGTYDGANIEIVEAAGESNNVIFGARIEELEALGDAYDPVALYESEPRIRRALDSLIDGTFADPDGRFRELYDSLLKGASWHRPDAYYLVKDFLPYQEARQRAFALYADSDRRAEMALQNIAHAGRFSSDRSVREYAEKIWHVE